MYYINKTIFSLLAIIILSSCSKDGIDGEVYLRIRAVLNPLEFSIENPDIPVNFQESNYDVFYKTKPGSYPFTYIDHFGDQHPKIGELSVLNLEIEQGQSGSLLSTGDNGRDIYVDLILLSSGPIVTNLDYYTPPSSLEYTED